MNSAHIKFVLIKHLSVCYEGSSIFVKASMSACINLFTHLQVIYIYIYIYIKRGGVRVYTFWSIFVDWDKPQKHNLPRHKLPIVLHDIAPDELSSSRCFDGVLKRTDDAKDSNNRITAWRSMTHILDTPGNRRWSTRDSKKDVKTIIK